MVIQRGNIRVLEGHVVAITWDKVRNFEHLSDFGIKIDTEEEGYVTLHLITGGEISITTLEPEKEAQEWAILTGLV